MSGQQPLHMSLENTCPANLQAITQPQQSEQPCPWLRSNLILLLKSIFESQNFEFTLVTEFKKSIQFHHLTQDKLFLAWFTSCVSV